MRELTCIVCPKGCALTVDENSDPIAVSGEGCKRGIKYGRDEVVDPRRVLTTTVKVKDGTRARVAVKTALAIPKPLLFDAMDILNELNVEAPIKVGQTVVCDLLNCGIDVVATANCNKRYSEE